MCIRDRFSTDWRYFRLDSEVNDFIDDPTAPPEAITGGVRVNLTDNWSLAYRASRDLDLGETQVQSLGLAFRDDCTLVELLYTKNSFSNDITRSADGLGIRISLLTLGELGN